MWCEQDHFVRPRPRPADNNTKPKYQNAEENNVQYGSFRHFEVNSRHVYEDMYSEIVSSNTNSDHIAHQKSPDSFCGLRKSYSEPQYSNPEGPRSPHWPPYMPPTPPIPHEYYLPSPPESPTCPRRIYSKSNFGNPGIEVSRQKRRTVRFSDHISIRIIFGGASEDDRDLVIDTQLVDAFGFGPAFGVGPTRVVVVRHSCRENILSAQLLTTAHKNI